MISIIIKLLVVGLLLYGNAFADDKINRAISENKLVVFYFKSQFCSYCAQVEDFVFSDEEVFKKLSNFVFVELDIRSDEGSKLARKFGVPGTPTVVIYDPKTDKVVGLIFGSRPKEDYLKTINKACKLYNIKTC
ncbi:thioredoxin fold domain-containing protein [Thermocrinis jamiesonii]|uniref:thioredoxin fold domain-containing protein n=1 Tax=Thermocrinis jamiesonii TaxID=1302351 RepID=UPI000692129A|nr:thioredoxin fold domain-containing protein [Thermocrinis jamiesonii]